jgi:type I restriction enzyme S subunit
MTLTVPLPSLAEQQHIVAKLDEQMAAVDRAEKALAEQQAAASDFLQAALEAVFDLAAHPAWPQVRLGAVSDVIDRKVDPQQHTSQMYAHYSIPAFDTGEGPIFELGSEIRSAKCEVADGCVLFSKLNPRIPRVWHVHDHVDVPRICSTEFLVLQPKLEHVIATYLTWILQSPPFLRTIRSRVQAATKSRERVPENVVVSTPILVPSLGEQQRIVAKLDEQMMSLGLVQSALAHQTADLGGLRSTLLNAVFSGEV